MLTKLLSSVTYPKLMHLHPNRALSFPADTSLSITDKIKEDEL